MGALKYPASIDWEVTSFCNHNCIHCYNCWRSEIDKNKDITFNKNTTTDYYNNIARKIVESNPVSVIITGGEPLSVFWKIESAINYLLVNGIYVSMNTNLTLINDEIAKKIKEFGIHIFTSIPSANKENCDKITGKTNSFKAIDAGIRMCLKYDIPVSTNMVLTKINENDMSITAEYIKNLGINYFCCTKAAFPANAREELKKEILSYSDFNNDLSKLISLGAQMKMKVDSAWAYSLCGLCGEQISVFGFKRRCGAGRFNFAITCNGDIKACNVDTIIYGNILNNSMSEAIDKMTDWQTNTYLPNECKDCKSLYLCGGGCRLEAQNTFGDKCHLDSTANINNKDVFIESPSITKFDYKSKYKLKNDVKIIEENTCFRMSRKSLYEFISKECKDFFMKNKEFTFYSFKKELDLHDDLAKREFAEFIDKKFIDTI